jgi:hypothetical protein
MVWPFFSVGELFIGQMGAPRPLIQQVVVKTIIMNHCFEKQQETPSAVKLRITNALVTAWFLSFR